MSQAANRQTDLEMGDGGIQAIAGDHPGPSQSTSNQPLRPPPEESDLNDISGSIYSVYSRLAEAEDNGMAMRCQKDAAGILIFTGLFSAAVAALLAVSVQDLRQSPQAKSEFYLQNIYYILGNQSINVSPTSIPSPAAQPPTFSPPKYAIWVNSLWFLSLVIGLTGALLATMLQQWARQYIRLTQPAQCNIEKRARMRAFFADGVDNMGFPRAVEALPALLHLSLFLFFSGLVIFLWNVNHTVSLCATLCIGLFSVVYACITVMPMLWHNSPYYTPLSQPTSYITVVILFVITCLVFLVLFYSTIVYGSYLAVFDFFLLFSPGTGYLRGSRVRNSRTLLDMIMSVSLVTLPRYQGLAWIPLNYLLRLFLPIYRNFLHWVSRLWNKGKATDKIILEQLSSIDLGILTWMVGALGEDDTLGKLLEKIPGFLNANMAKGFEIPLPDKLGSRFVDSVCGFLGRNLSSASFDKKAKTNQSIICMNAVDKMCDSRGIQKFLLYISRPRFNQVLSIQIAQNLSRLWCAGSEGRVSLKARQALACILLHIPERDDDWIELAKDQLGIPEQASGLRALIADGDDSVSQYFFLHMTCEVIRTNYLDSIDLTFLSRLAKFDVNKAHPELQNAFCALWNEIVRDARTIWSFLLPKRTVLLLREIRHHYIALHQGTEAAPIAFNASTVSANPILSTVWAYPLCTIAAHHPNPSGPPPTDDPHDPSPGSTPSESQPAPGGSTGPQQIEEANIFPGLPPAADSTSHHAQVLPTPFQTTDPVHIPPQAPSVTDPSSHEYIEMVPLDPNRLVSTEASGLSRRSSLPTADLTVNSVRSDERTPDMLINEFGENPQTPAATSLTFSHPDPVLATVTSSTVSRPPSVSVQQPDTNIQQGIAAPCVASDIAQISSAAYTGATLQTSEESTAGLPTTVSGSPSSPIMIPAFHSGVTSPEPSSPVETPLVQPDDTPHAPGPLSPSPATAHSDNSPEVTLALNTRVFAGTDTPGTHDTSGMAHSIPTEAPHDANQPAPATPDTIL